LAGSVPGWDEGYGYNATYQPRYLLSDGRVFFNSPDALVPQASNGLEDVYEYEPVGVGDCTREGAAFSERSGGCVSLISSGISGKESRFYDASESGDDVFFSTDSKLVPEDYDASYDVYDAHVCSSTAPCHIVPVTPPPCTSGDSCKAAPTPQPEIFGPTPSATFSGTGNVTGLSTASVEKKSLTRAQKLAHALQRCHKKRRRKLRAVCERQARKTYRFKQSRSIRVTGKGR
jgi:hypothetical protein